MTSPISDNPLADDGQLLAWGYDLGADLEELDQLLSSGAVGLAVNSWRNTELENIHASTGVYEVVDALIPDDADDRDTLVSEEAGRRIAAYADTTCQPGSYGRVGDPAEQERLDAIVAGRREGHGIPDDLIMRANAFTAADIRSLLTGVVGDWATRRGGESAPKRRLQWVGAVTSHLLDLSRLLLVGCAEIRVGDLLGGHPLGRARTVPWHKYEEDALGKAARVMGIVEAVGARRALWYLALSGASYASRWFPHPWWADGVGRLRAQDPQNLHPGLANHAPFPVDDGYWSALRETPWLLNGTQTHRTILSDLEEQI